MNTYLNILDWKRSEMNTPAWVAYQETREYLLLKCRAFNWHRAFCGVEIEKLYRMERGDASEVWNMIYPGRLAEIRAGLPNLPEDQAADIARRRTEADMCNLDYVPPGWKGIADCEHCARVIVPTRDNGRKLKSCPWCQTSHGRTLAELCEEEDALILLDPGQADLELAKAHADEFVATLKHTYGDEWFAKLYPDYVNKAA